MSDKQRPTKRQRVSDVATTRGIDKPFLGPNMNRFMHERNQYKDKKVDFQALGEQYEKLRPFIFTRKDGSAMINFNDPNALREFTCAILDHDFGLKVTLPPNRLVPTVRRKLISLMFQIPNRTNYIHWLEDILPKSEIPLHGVDIGTGASCIYPILGHKLCGWTFLATEIDEFSLECAKVIVTENNLESAIETRLSPSTDAVLAGVCKEDERFDFCMCNPPFFDSDEQRDQDQFRAGRVAADTEAVCDGGEMEFIRKIIRDSVVMLDRIGLYTTMIGRKSTLGEVKKLLKGIGAKKIQTGKFFQGRTVRWAIAWKIDE